MHFGKKMIIGTAMMTLGFSGLVATAASDHRSSPHQLQEKVSQYTDSLDSQIDMGLDQTSSSMEKKNASLIHDIQKQIKHNASNSLKPYKKNIGDYKSKSISQIAQTKKELMEKVIFDTYKKEKEKEIEEKLEQVLKDILD
ncbi:hypothetical protein P5G51_005215 [Virgibacillus sp. 179-BFC.A HS]|uniref:Sporulation protein n=1 Tax=Tigheibacillus jepli TaxID=3035914 RepID=A0ABU5CG77_9BACI|nr:hypothetical protein [Virgibacillus sp. 179-BFC.A HS]MDY0404877.1 hypothetical protein [Virgibacillus sp. 179-BFC.A HS]